MEAKQTLATKKELGVLKAWEPSYSHQKNVYEISHTLDIPENKVNCILLEFLEGTLIPDNTFKSHQRRGKKELYDMFFKMVSQHVGFKISYVGLPGDEIDEITDRILSCDRYVDKCIFVEKDKSTYNYINYRYHNSVLNSFPNMSGIYNKDILDELKNSGSSYNVIDLDLMCHLESKKHGDLTEKIPHALHKMCFNASPCSPIAINLITSYGNGLTKDYYINNLRPRLINNIKKYFKVSEHIHGNYRDKRIPMMYEQFMLSY